MAHRKKTNYWLKSLLFVLFFFFTSSVNVLAQAGANCPPECMVNINLPQCNQCGIPQQGNVKSLGKFQGLGPLSDFINSLSPDSPAPATSMLTKLISIGIGVFTIIAFLWFIYTLFSGTLSWLTSGGDKAKLQEAQKRITSGLIGLILTFSAIFIIKIIGTILGFDILDLTTIVGGLWK